MKRTDRPLVEDHLIFKFLDCEPETHGWPSNKESWGLTMPSQHFKLSLSSDGSCKLEFYDVCAYTSFKEPQVTIHSRWQLLLSTESMFCFRFVKPNFDVEGPHAERIISRAKESGAWYVRYFEPDERAPSEWRREEGDFIDADGALADHDADEAARQCKRVEAVIKAR